MICGAGRLTRMTQARCNPASHLCLRQRQHGYTLRDIKTKFRGCIIEEQYRPQRISSSAVRIIPARWWFAMRSIIAVWVGARRSVQENIRGALD